MKKLFRSNNEEEHNFWISYTDLMAGFIIVFIVASIMVYNKLDKITKMMQGYTEDEVAAMIDWHKKHGNMVNINEDFKDVFNGVEGVTFVEKEGSIRFYPSGSATMLFEVGKYAIQQNLKTRLENCGEPFVRRAMELKKEGKNIAEIRIEGHTDIRGNFFQNLELSSNRAYAVYYYLYNCCNLSPDEQEFVKKYMISVGYSSQKSLDTYDKSRRIEFRIIAK